jgi:hypothetical protein
MDYDYEERELHVSQLPHDAEQHKYAAQRNFSLMRHEA